MKISRTHKPEGLSLEEWQRILRKQYGEQQNYQLENTGNHPFFTEFKLTNPESGKVYKIAVRGDAPGDNYCSCPDYSINNLGTCKHIEFTLSWLMKRKEAKKAFMAEYTPPYSEIYLHYGLKRDVRFKAGKDASPEVLSLVNKYFDIVAKLVAKWRRYKFLCEADQRRLQIALNYMRMAADNTCLVDKKTIHGPKIEELEIILKEMIVEGGEKVVIFSQWLRMTELVEHVLKRNRIGYVHLNGNIPSKQRAGLMTQFKENHECKVFLSTDAGGVGLNLQSGSTVINMDIPWNPAVLEQRIGRVHRLGQQKTVRVINFVTTSSIEERMLDLLKFKKSLFAGTLDSDGENVVMVGESQLKRFMQSVETLTDNLEKVDTDLERQDQIETELDEKMADIKELTMEEGGYAISAAEGDKKGLDHLHNLLNCGAQFLLNLSKVITHSDQSIEKHLETAISRDEKTGKAYLKIPLPETEVVKTLFSTLGELMSKTLQMKN